METKYIYSASKANTLSQFLLSKTDIERLLVADPGTDLHEALKETYLAEYIVHVPDESVPLAIEETLKHAKKLIHRITPKGDMFRIMWVQYDIHNLRTFAKAAVAGLPFEDCKHFLSERGIYSPQYLYEHVTNSTLNNLQMSWQDSYDQAVQSAASGDLGHIDSIFDELYFATSKRIVGSVGDAFMHTYLKALIDLYNLKSRLRHLKNKTVSFGPEFVEGGTFGSGLIETEENVFSMFERLDGVGYWTEALEFYKQTGNFTKLDSKSADYLLTVAKQGSYDMFSSASLVLYYLKCRQAAANIRTIVVGKNSGISEMDIRANLRMAYVND